MDLRHEFVLRAQSRTQSFKSLCEEFQISRKTGYKWLERFQDEGSPGLADQSKRPHNSSEKLDEMTICKIIRIKNDHAYWGPKKIHALYMRAAHKEVSLSSVKRILERSGLVQKRRKRCQRETSILKENYSVAAPNDLWTIDFKGWWYAEKHQKFEPLTIRDEYSCFILEARSLPSTGSQEVKKALERVFRIYGLPKVIKTDNGCPFAHHNSILGLTHLSAWWISLGIRLDRIDPGKPQQNGAHERMHRDIKNDIQKHIRGTAEHIQNSLDVWRESFNRVRPHEKLKMKTPAEFYQKSSRVYRPDDTRIIYPLYFFTRKVWNTGFINIQHERIYIGKALAGLEIGITDIDENYYIVYFDYLKLGLIDRQTFAFKRFNHHLESRQKS